MKYGVIHYNTPGANLEEFLAWASDSGFDCTELEIPDIWPQDEENPEKRAEEVRALLEKYSMAPTELAAHNDFNVVDPDAVDFQINRMKRIFNLAEIAGFKIIRTEGGSPKDTISEDQVAGALANCLKRCIPFTEEKQISMAVDNHGYLTNNADLLYNVLTEVNHPLIGSNLDTMNYRWYGYSIEELDAVYKRIAPFVKHTHLKDGTGTRDAYKGAALGEGEIHLEYAVKVLKEAGYKGPWIAEYEGPEGDGVGYKKCLAWMKAHI